MKIVIGFNMNKNIKGEFPLNETYFDVFINVQFLLHRSKLILDLALNLHYQDVDQQV